MFSARSPSRLSVPSLCLPFRFSFRSAFSCLPVLRVGWRGVGRCRRGAGRRVGSVSSVGCLLGRCGSVLSWSWSVCLFHCISFRGGFRCWDVCFRASSAAYLVFVLVPFCAFPSVLVRPRLVAACRLVVRFPSRLSRRCGCAAAWRLLARLCPLWLAVRAMSSVSSRSRLSLVRYGERGGWMSGVSCLLEVGVDVDVICGVSVSVPVAVRSAVG